jgi:DNA-binding NarL/FixJ family response regulator
MGLSFECMLLSSFDSEFTFLRNICGTTGIRMHHARSIDETDFLLTVTGGMVLLSDVIFEGGYWQDAASLLAESHPLVSMLVVADPVDEPFLSDLYDRGACGVIWKPFEYALLIRQLQSAYDAATERIAMQREAISRGPGPTCVRSFLHPGAVNNRR